MLKSAGVGLGEEGGKGVCLEGNSSLFFLDFIV